jgi:hypothetical protein
MRPLITIITPTTGKPSINRLIDSIKKQKIFVQHFLLWDDKKEGEFIESYKENNYILDSINISGSVVTGCAFGSALRSIGLMAAQTDYVTFADDDVYWDENHLETMLSYISDLNWVCSKRKIFNDEEYLGIDDFESVGEEAKTPYKMVDNNCMLFKRKFGALAAILYRETNEYNDDRLMYQFLMKYAGKPAKTNKATINQNCPKKLVNFFKNNCTKS